jgi:dTDP-4-dehydrorhamnose 3,5-epimerase
MIKEIKNMKIEDVKLIIPKKFSDSRGYFVETFRESDYVRIGISGNFKQDSQSFSKRGTLRGLHFQQPPHAQGKLVRCVSGAIMDIAVDVRKNSPTFGEYVSAELSGRNMNILWIPEGFAHGFIALKNSVVLYKATSEYHRESESGLLWNDETVGIIYPEIRMIISEKDKSWHNLETFVTEFEYGVNS